MKKSEKDKLTNQSKQLTNLNKFIDRVLKLTTELDNIEEGNKVRIFNLDNEISEINKEITKEFKDHLDTQEKDNTECKECDKKNTYDL